MHLPHTLIARNQYTARRICGELLLKRYQAERVDTRVRVVRQKVSIIAQISSGLRAGELIIDDTRDVNETSRRSWREIIMLIHRGYALRETYAPIVVN